MLDAVEKITWFDLFFEIVFHTDMILIDPIRLPPAQFRKDGAIGIISPAFTAESFLIY